MDKIKLNNSNQIFERISLLLKQARNSVLQHVNLTMVVTYFEIGKLIIEGEQSGQKRASYGKFIMVDLAKRLTDEFGKGFSQRNLEQMRQFYLTYSKTQTPSAEFNLSWSHMINQLKISNLEIY